MKTELTGYRFQDAQNEGENDSTGESRQVVEFYPSLDDYVAVAQLHSKKYNGLTSLSTLSLQGFLFVNWFALPAVLFFFGYGLAALAFLGLNIAFALLFLPAVMRTDYRRYYRYVFGDNFENELVRVELSENGISIRQRDDAAFYSWNSVTGIEDRAESIFVHLRASTLPIRKSGFAYTELERSFLAFLREHRAGSSVDQLPK